MKTLFSFGSSFTLTCFIIAVVITPTGSLQARQAVSESDWIELEFRSQEFLTWLRIYFSEGELYDIHLADSTADPDGDGYSNQFEFLAKLDPTDRETRFKIYFSGEAREELRIGPVVSGVTYETQTSTDLKEWTTISSSSYQQVGDEYLINLQSMPPKSFYRVILSD